MMSQRIKAKERELTTVEQKLNLGDSDTQTPRHPDAQTLIHADAQTLRH